MTLCLTVFISVGKGYHTIASSSTNLVRRVLRNYVGDPGILLHRRLGMNCVIMHLDAAVLHEPGPNGIQRQALRLTPIAVGDRLGPSERT